jgi:4-amino-4-deoxy-L-arabinose transferase-like glycosyltransferase
MTVVILPADDLAVQPLDTPVKPAPKTPIWQKLAPGLVLLLSLFVNFYNLGQNGFGNLYYATTVRSMADSLHNFFFVSYDPGGFISIDKPPLGFWFQTISVKVFGFTPFAVLLPQALAGSLSVLVLYFLVRRHFGFAAGLLAALALAISPLNVATNRDGTIDSTLLLTLLLSAWIVIKAAETGRWRWLLLGALVVGIGFNIKGLQAYLVLPAFGILYLVTAPRSIWMRIAQLTVALAVLLAVSLWWPVAVDLTPASQRPHVGASPTNSEIDLTFGYNGLQHLGQGGEITDQSNAASTQAANSLAGRIFSIIIVPIALLSPFLGGQIAWFLPIALLAIFVPGWRRRRGGVQDDHSRISWMLWRVWLLTLVCFFSITNSFYLYYMAILTPAICALFGISIVTAWRKYARGEGRGWFLALGLLFTALEQISINASNPAWGSGLIPLIALLTVLTVLVMVVSRLKIPRVTALRARILAPLFSLAVAVLFLTPMVWSVAPALQNRVMIAPRAGPDVNSFVPKNSPTPSATVDGRLVRYLEDRQATTKYLAATINSVDADGLIIVTNKPVMALGGFGGTDSFMTPTSVQAMIASNTVRFFYMNSAAAHSGVAAHDDVAATSFPIASWVDQNCRLVPTADWASSPQSLVAHDGMSGVMQLYDCAGA